jgi:hypothetical protein
MRARGDDQTMLDSADEPPRRALEHGPRRGAAHAPWRLYRQRLDDLLAHALLRPHPLRGPEVRPQRPEPRPGQGARRRVRHPREHACSPGPIESERIDTVFANMDALQGSSRRQTSKEFRGAHDHAARNAGRRVRLPLPDALRRGLDHHLPGLRRVRLPVGARLRGDERYAGAGAEPLQACVLAGQAPRRPERDQVVLVLGGSEVEEAAVLRRAPHDVAARGWCWHSAASSPWATRAP